MEPSLDLLRASWLLVRSPVKVSRAYHLQVMVTDRCNLACAGCSRADPLHRPTNRNMPLETYERILERLRPRKVTLIGEGDPLLHPRIVELVRAASGRGAGALLATNLSLGGSELYQDLVDAGVESVRVLLSHSDRARYREIKGRDIFELVLGRLALLRQLRPAGGGRGPKLLLEFWIDPGGLDEIEGHLRLAARHGVRSASFLAWLAAEQRGSLQPENRHLKTLQRAVALARRLGMRTNLELLCARAERAVREQRNTPAGASRNGRRASCALPWLRAFVDLDGRLGPCVDLVTHARSDPGIALDDALDARSPAPYGGPFLRQLRSAFREGRPPHALCEGCVKGRIASLWNDARVRSLG